MIIIKEKDEKKTVLIHGRYSRKTDIRRRYLKKEKLISLKCAVMRLRYCTARTGFHVYGEYIYLYVNSFNFFVTSFSERC